MAKKAETQETKMVKIESILPKEVADKKKNLAIIFKAGKKFEVTEDEAKILIAKKWAKLI